MPISYEKIIESLKNQIDLDIYSRSLIYFENGQVKGWKVAKNPAENLFIINGKIRGTEIYEVRLEYDVQREEFSKLECTCPFGDICKHIVALGLAFAYSQDKTTYRKYESTIINTLFEQKIIVKEEENKKTEQGLALVRKKIPSEDYQLIINLFDNFSINFHKKGDYYQANIIDIQKKF
jgi:uncharacterized Zn finger protein